MLFVFWLLFSRPAVRFHVCEGTAESLESPHLSSGVLARFSGKKSHFIYQGYWNWDHNTPQSKIWFNSGTIINTAYAQLCFSLLTSILLLLFFYWQISFSRKRRINLSIKWLQLLFWEKTVFNQGFETETQILWSSVTLKALLLCHYSFKISTYSPLIVLLNWEKYLYDKSKTTSN